ncbi:MAG: DUF6057 family protein [candidate division KSB1 bacterium]|nr:DUF6057 family protein [candidate division KSB1 bacterium]
MESKKKLIQIPFKGNLHTLVRTGIFFLLFYLYLWLWINPALYYQRQEPVFLLDSRFFREFLSYPGGLVEYVAAFLSQFYYYPWVGALIITLIAWLICLATQRFIKSVSGVHQVQVLHLVPAIFLLILHNQYKHPLATSLGLLLSLVFLNLYVRIAPGHAGLRLVVYLFLSVILYYTTAGPFLLFALLCGLYEIFSAGRLLLGLFYGLTAVVIPYLAATYIFLVSLNQAYFHLLSFEINYRPQLTPHALYLFFPLTVLVIAIYRRFGFKQEPEGKTKWLFSFLKKEDFLTSKPKFILQTLALFIVAGVAAFLSFDRNTNTILQVDYYARREMWQQVLQLAKRRGTELVPVAYQTNRALYHTGRLPYEMFSFPQKRGAAGLLLTRGFALSAPLETSDLFFELGHVNEAQHWAHEALSTRGETPWNLQRLALINILKGDHQAAQSFLDVLSKTLFHRAWAQHYRRYLTNDSLLAADKQLQHIRSLMINSDFIASTDYPVADLVSLLKRNKQNKMAFEYMMAFYLLTHRLGNFVNNIGRLNDFNYPVIPRHYEEALLLYIMMTGRRDLNIRISTDTMERFKDFNQILARHGEDEKAAREELWKTHGNSYWFYIRFINPITRKPSSNQPGDKK